MQTMPHGEISYCERFAFARAHKLAGSPNVHQPRVRHAVFLRGPMSLLHFIKVDTSPDLLWAMRSLLYEAAARSYHVWLVLGSEAGSESALHGEVGALVRGTEFAHVALPVARYMLKAQFPAFHESWFQADHHTVLAWMQLTRHPLLVDAARAPALGLGFGGPRPGASGGEQPEEPDTYAYDFVFTVEQDVRYTGRNWGVFLDAAWRHARAGPAISLAAPAARSHHAGSRPQHQSGASRAGPGAGTVQGAHGQGVSPDLLMFNHPCTVNDLWIWAKEPANFSRASAPGVATRIPLTHRLHGLAAAVGHSGALLALLADYYTGGSFGYMELMGPSLAVHHGMKLAYVQPGALYNITNTHYQIGWVRPGACMDWPWETNDTAALATLGGGVYECCGDEIIGPVYVGWTTNTWCQGFALMHPIKVDTLPWPPPAPRRSEAAAPDAGGA
eukprot:CAMPEP_0202880518 /NCGR_PEP_ID=MMETSP1391-20130828/35186_1 /ASSEMBLY_ACC=CAM_ASM_000867 /TAXON_ID=1034604 /ORGANISM="Chlamydomonas leiostraca, Strain SAG 11-49" /LENGTH=444 /DNA_ID=CAMNT_0049563039 /DNA_START=218 /DNA_END=1552 /DNA_ORIENTATION=-